MTFSIPAAAEAFVLNTGKCMSDDSLWIEHCARWHPYWLEKERLSVESVFLEYGGNAVEFASKAELLVILDGYSPICKAVAQSFTVQMKSLDLSNSAIKTAVFCLFPRLKRLNVSFTLISALNLACNHEVEVIHACECQSLHSVELPAESYLTELCITGAHCSALNLASSALLTHLNLCGSQFDSLCLPAHLAPNYGCPDSFERLLGTVTFVDISGAPCRALPLAYMKALRYLGVSRSDVRELDTPGDALECLDVSFTFVSALPRLWQLRGLYCEGAPLQSFELADFPLLEEANLSSTSLETITLAGGQCLQVLKLAQTLLFELDFSHFYGKLRELDIAESEIGSIDCSRLEELRYLDVFKCGIARLDTQHLTKLEVLLARESALFFCNFSHFQALKQCDVSSTQLMQINLACCGRLESLNVCGTAIAEVDCTGAPMLRDLRASEGCVIAGWDGKRGD